jgi:hypothetical protein
MATVSDPGPPAPVPIAVGDAGGAVATTSGAVREAWHPVRAAQASRGIRARARIREVMLER